MISHLLDKVDNFENKDINEMLVKSTILHGKLTELVKEARDPKGDKGKEISDLEKKDIFDAITDLENKILKIKLTIDSKSK
jgi:regulator of replication initiation timing